MCSDPPIWQKQVLNLCDSVLRLAGLCRTLLGSAAALSLLLHLKEHLAILLSGQGPMVSH